jgi:predicted site-specific integrase-resolvase
MRVAIYARVSMDDRGQDPENQLISLHEWCARSGTTSSPSMSNESGRESRRDSR